MLLDAQPNVLQTVILEVLLLAGDQLALEVSCKILGLDFNGLAESIFMELVSPIS